MSATRDPKQDPQPGDVVIKTNMKGKQTKRTVTGRKGNDVYYTTKDGGKVNNCWITTWWDWCRTAD